MHACIVAIQILLNMLAAVNITIENKSTTNADIETGTLAPGAWTLPPPSTIAPNQTAEAVVH